MGTPCLNTKSLYERVWDAICKFRAPKCNFRGDNCHFYNIDSQ
jgi:hypothetical protein